MKLKIDSCSNSHETLLAPQLTYYDAKLTPGLVPMQEVDGMSDHLRSVSKRSSNTDLQRAWIIESTTDPSL